MITEPITLINKLRGRNREYRRLIDLKKISYTNSSLFCTNVIEISCAIAELAIQEKRKIKQEEKYWFDGAYIFNFEFGNGAYKDILELYLDINDWLRQNNFLNRI